MRKLLKITAALAVLLVLISASCKEVTGESDLAEGEVIATVCTDFSDDGCPVLLEVSQNGEDILLMPIEWEGKYSKHGMKLAVKYTLSRIRQEECLKGMPAVIHEVRKLR